ncbi:A-kinase anchor protein 5 [Myiozetetes cayanensis]|uniref:A-kinase anchor protein 5 n=1 Tax=Myiozetetes cayanensis TaxID=478635 RepID=UPI00215F5BFA|nr:A-kinase anchor protein 5 [Myiozetetes cayanensis]
MRVTVASIDQENRCYNADEGGANVVRAAKETQMENPKEVETPSTGATCSPPEEQAEKPSMLCFKKRKKPCKKGLTVQDGCEGASEEKSQCVSTDQGEEKVSSPSQSSKGAWAAIKNLARPRRRQKSSSRKKAPSDSQVQLEVDAEESCAQDLPKKRASSGVKMPCVRFSRGKKKPSPSEAVEESEGSVQANEVVGVLNKASEEPEDLAPMEKSESFSPVSAEEDQATVKEDQATVKEDQDTAKEDQDTAKEDQDTAKEDQATVKEDQAAVKEDQASVKEDQAAVKEDQAAVKEDQAAVKEDQAAVKEDQAAVKEDQATVKEDQATVKEDQASVKEDQAAVKEDQDAVKEDQDAVKEDQDTVKEDQATVKEDQATVKEDQAAVKEDQAAVKEDQATVKEDQATVKEDQFAVKEDQATVKEDQATVKEDQATVKEDQATVKEDQAIVKEDQDTAKESDNSFEKSEPSTEHTPGVEERTECTIQSEITDSETVNEIAQDKLQEGSLPQTTDDAEGREAPKAPVSKDQPDSAPETTEQEEIPNIRTELPEGDESEKSPNLPEECKAQETVSEFSESTSRDNGASVQECSSHQATSEANAGIGIGVGIVITITEAEDSDNTDSDQAYEPSPVLHQNKQKGNKKSNRNADVGKKEGPEAGGGPQAEDKSLGDQGHRTGEQYELLLIETASSLVKAAIQSSIEQLVNEMALEQNKHNSFL